MNSLPDIQKKLKSALPAQGAAFVLHSLLELLPESSPKYNLVIALQAELRTWQTAALSGILSEEVKSLKASQLNIRILEFIDGLTPEDFDKNTRRSRITEDARIRKGNVLYQIPREMKLEAECRCLVRIAFDKETLLEALDVTVHTEMREQIRISDYMKVEIVDPSSTPVFRIVARSAPIQLIDEDDYTEWRFLVTPLKTGRHVLELKVSGVKKVFLALTGRLSLRNMGSKCALQHFYHQRALAACTAAAVGATIRSSAALRFATAARRRFATTISASASPAVRSPASPRLTMSKKK